MDVSQNQKPCTAVILLVGIVTLIWMFNQTDFISLINDQLTNWNVHRNIYNVTNSSTENDSYNTLERFNDELFCPIKNKTGHKSGMYALLHDIYKLQYLDDCYDEKNRFWIYDLTHSCDRIGLFAMLNCWSFYFTQSFLLQRTFLFSGTFYNYAPKEYCSELGYECFFRPISNCNATDIINYYINNSYIEYTPQTAGNINPPQIPMPYDVFNESLGDQITENVWILKGYGFRKSLIGHYSKIRKKYHLHDSNEYEVLLWNIFLRLKPDLEQQINKIVAKSLMNSNVFNSQNIRHKTLSMPIRWGDKCANDPKNKNKTRITPEMLCWNVLEYMELAQILKQITPELDYIVITSETKKIVDLVTNYTDIGYKFIKNVDDIMQGISVFFRKDYSTNSNPIINMLSLLSTIRLHFGSKYFIFTKESNWIAKIFKMAVFLECDPIKRYVLLANEEKRHMECIELSTGRRSRFWTNNTNRIAILSKKLYSEYFERKWKPHEFNVRIANDTTCDRINNLMFY